MKKRFVTKKRRKIFPTIKIIVFLIIILIIYLFTMKFLNNLTLKDTNSNFIKIVLNDSNHAFSYETKTKDIIKKITNTILNIDINKPKTILENSFNYKITLSKNEKIKEETVFLEKKESEPIIYIYNSHQSEDYSNSNVKEAGVILKEKLQTLNINSLILEEDLNDFIRINNWNYNDSYKASRYYLKDAIEKNKSLKYFIDLHRDAIKKDVSTIEIDGKKYAKLLFVIGTDNPSYLKNMELVSKIDQELKNRYPGISRGIMTHGGIGYNGVYNQDLNSNVILLECGGYENTKDEVRNSLEAFSKIFKDIIGD